MAADVIFPTAMELHEIAQEKLPNLMADREIFKILPVKNYDTFEVEWEQKDRYKGLQQVRGLNGEPARVKDIGLNRFQYKAGVYGEFISIEEDQLTRRRKPGTFGTAIDLTDWSTDKQDYLIQRRLDLIEKIGWTLLTTNTFAIANGAGAILHTDTGVFRTFSSLVAWGTAATATPLDDFREIFKLHRGYSVKFDSNAKAYMNQGTYQKLINNANPLDLYGRRKDGLATINNEADVNSLLTKDNLPQIVIYDETYQDENDQYQLFIPDNKVIVVGKRPGNVPVGSYAMVRNATNPDMAPGAYTRVVDSADHGRPVPRQIAIHDGHNGGPLVEFPSSVIIATVG